jgi:hypothetical protein
MAVNKAGSGGRGPAVGEAAPDGQFIAHVLMPISPAEAAPQEPAVEADPPLLDDYEQPTLDPVDLDLDLDEEEEGLTIEPAVREPALDYALGEEEEGEESLEDLIVENRSEGRPVRRTGQYGRARPTTKAAEEGGGVLDSISEFFSGEEGGGMGPRGQGQLKRWTDEGADYGTGQYGRNITPGTDEDADYGTGQYGRNITPGTDEDADYGTGQYGRNITPGVVSEGAVLPDATYLQRRAAESGGYVTPKDPQTFDEVEVEEDDPLLPGPISLPVKAEEEEEAVAVAAPTIAEAVELPEDAGPGLLDRLAGMGGKIGQLVRENPDLVLQGLRTIGELGGEYKRGRREQEAADRMAQEARMGTAISALTRGRVNPTVTPRMPRTSAGEGMFDVLAGIGRGGQEFMGQKRALEEQERLEGIEDETLAAERAEKDRRFGLDKYRAETERMAVAGKDPEGPEGEKAEIQAQKVDDAQMIMAHVSGLLETFDRGGPFTTGALAGAVAGERNYDPFGDAPAVQQEYDSQKIVLFEFVKRLGDLGRLSDKDVELIERTLPDKFTGKQRLQGAYNGIAKVLSRSTKGAFEAGPSPFEEGYDPERNMRLLRMGQATSPQAESISEEEQEELVERAEEGDAEAIAELQRHGLI